MIGRRVFPPRSRKTDLRLGSAATWRIVFKTLNVRRPKSDVIVLNSVSLTATINDEIAKYEAVHCFLDNDDAGRESLKKIREMASGRKVVDQSRLYGEFKDFNEYLMESESGVER